jgi:putative two-component system response regulator
VSKPHLVCVDDERILLESLRVELRRELGAEFQVESAESAEEALTLIRQLTLEGIELVMVISDENMPGMKGHKLLAEVRKLSPSTALVLMTGYADLDAVREAVNVAGLYRYLNKPWRIEELAFTVRQARRLQDRQKTIVDQRGKIGRLTKSMIFALETANQNSDEDTAYHIERIGEYSAFLAARSGCEPAWVDRIRLYAGLHDIGKVGVACQLLGVEKYTAKEHEVQKLHVRYGGQILGAEGIDPMASNIARYHHERWDGRGYLEKLVGEAIPLEARIVALVDVFDALSSPRIYRDSLPFDLAFDQVAEMGGTWFDPHLVLTFRDCREELRAIRDRVNARDDLRRPFTLGA